MIQIERAIEQGEHTSSGLVIQWEKFADGFVMMLGRYQFNVEASNETYIKTITLPISFPTPQEVAVTVTNVYLNRAICSWSATMMSGNELRFDCKPDVAATTGLILGCSFILFGQT